MKLNSIKKKRLMLVLLILVVICSCLVGTLLLVPKQAPDENVLSFPIHMSAHGVMHEQRKPDKGAEWQAGVGYLRNVGILHFATSDQPDIIYDYYDAWFLANGWQFDGVGGPTRFRLYSKEYYTFDGLQLIPPQFGSLSTLIPRLRSLTLHTRYNLRLFVNPGYEGCAWDGRRFQGANGVCIELAKYTQQE